MKILKYVVSIGLFVGGIRALVEGNVLMSIFFILAGLLVFPTISEILKSKITLWQNKYARYGVIVGLVIVGGALKSKADKQKLESTPEFLAEKFVKENPNNKLIKIADTLLKLDDYFDNEDSKKYFYDKNFKANSDGKVLYKFLNIKNDSLFKDYQNLENGNYIVDYNLIFDFKDNNVNSVKAIAKYSNGTEKEFSESNVVSIEKLLNTSEILKMREAVAKLAETQKLYKENEEKKAKFEQECFTGMDGYNLPLVNYVKENLHDADSFEHVETKFKLMDGYVVVVMKYRAKNGFNAMRLNQVTAKINYDCQVIEVTE